ncbi:MAG: hypothetical protein ACYTXA_10520 [Nostoc sp.]
MVMLIVRVIGAEIWSFSWFWLRCLRWQATHAFLLKVVKHQFRKSRKTNLRRLLKRLVQKYGYPPEKQEKATVLQQASN